MRTVLKVVLVMVAIGVAGAALLGVGAYTWFTRNKGRFVEMGKRASADADQFAATHTGAQCVDDALVRLDRANGLMAEAEVKVFLNFCLERAAESKGLCDGVPARDDLLKAAGWGVAKCLELGRPASQKCTQLVQAIPEHCGKRTHAAPAGKD